MRIFLDVGSHTGQTLEEVTRPQYGFKVYGFEPMPVQYQALVAAFDDKPNVILLNYGLSDKSCDKTLYGDNSQMEASVFSNKYDVDYNVQTVCKFVQASGFLRAIQAKDVTLKLNCEGAEVEILDDLIRSGEIWSVGNLMIDFDIRKVPGGEREAKRVLKELDGIGYDRYHLSENVMHGPTHQARIANWLRTSR